MKFLNLILGLGLMLCSCNAVSGQQQQQSPPLSALVPRIDQEGFQLQPDGQKYSLVISLPDGSSRSENVELLAPGTVNEEISLIGEIHERYPGAEAITIYKAGRNGYTVKYKYAKETLPPPLALPASALKSAAG